MSSAYSASENNPNVILKSNYYVNYFLNQHESNRYPMYEHRWKMLQNIKHIAASDDKNLPSITISQDKDAEADKFSTTSSTTTTNFTGNYYWIFFLKISLNFKIISFHSNFIKRLLSKTEQIQEGNLQTKPHNFNFDLRNDVYFRYFHLNYTADDGHEKQKNAEIIHIEAH